MRKFIAIVLIIIGIGSIVYTGFHLFKKENKKTAAVYPVQELMTPSEYIYDETYYGNVYADRFQTVNLSTTQEVKEILVQDGQEVKKGDPLVSFDTTLSEIKLEKAENDLAQKEFDLKKATNELEKINRLVPHNTDDTYYEDNIDEPEPQPEENEEENPIKIEYDPQETNVLLRGDGTLTNPYVYLWSPDDALSIENLVSMYLGGTPFYFDDEDDETTEIADVETNDSTETDITEEIVPMLIAPFRPINVFADEIDTSSDVEEGFEVGNEIDVQETEAIPDDSVLETPDVIDAEPDNVESAVEIPDNESTEEYIEESIEEQVEVPDDETTENENNENENINMVEEAEEIADVIDLTASTISPAKEKIIEETLKDKPNEIYVVLEIHKYNNSDAELLKSYGLHLIRSGGDIAIRLFDPLESSSETSDENNFEIPTSTEEEDDANDDESTYPDDYDYDDDSDTDDDSDDDDNDDIYSLSYTQEEINNMRKQKEEDIRDATIEYKQAVIEVREMKEEMKDGFIRSKIDGVVKDMQADNPIMKITGGGYFYAIIPVNEYSLNKLKKGQKVKLESYYSGECTGTIDSVSEFPTQESSYMYSELATSFYPCKIILDTENAQEGDYVEVQLESTKGLYMDNMYILKESGKSYVYVEEDGKIIKRQIQTGKVYDGYTTQVLSGLSEDEYIAFPYGVEEGMITEKATVDSLYESSYY